MLWSLALGGATFATTLVLACLGAVVRWIQFPEHLVLFTAWTMAFGGFVGFVGSYANLLSSRSIVVRLVAALGYAVVTVTSWVFLLALIGSFLGLYIHLVLKLESVAAWLGSALVAFSIASVCRADVSGQ